MNNDYTRCSVPNRIFKLAIGLQLLLFTHIAVAQIIYVDQAALKGIKTGVDWTNAYTDLQDALATASPGAQIWVAKGTYYPSTVVDRQSSFVLKDSVELYGGFAGTENQLEQRNWKDNHTILSGDLRQNDGPDFSNTEDNAYSVIYSINLSKATIIDGFIVTGGNANDINSSELEKGKCGGAWFNEAKSDSLESSPRVRNCSFIYNQAQAFGGAIYNSAFFSGRAYGSYANCTFSYNRSGNDGGALYNQGSFNGIASPKILDCIFQFNQTNASGGAIFNNGLDGKSSPEIHNSIFKYNIANADNLGIGNGGAIYNLGKRGICSPIIVNSIFHHNEGYSAGAIYNLGSEKGNSSPTVLNSTFYANKAVGSSGFGGAIYNNAHDELGNSNTQIVNCIFWKNQANGVPSVLRNIYSSPTISFSIVDVSDCSQLNDGLNGNLTCGQGLMFDTDPMFTDAVNEDFHLQTGSPAINAGDDSSVVDMNIHADLDNTNRIQDGQVDLGVYESIKPVPPVIDTLIVSSTEIVKDTTVLIDTTFAQTILIENDSLLLSTQQSSFDTLILPTIISYTDTLTSPDSLAMHDTLFVQHTQIKQDSFVVTELVVTTDTLIIYSTQITIDSTFIVENFNEQSTTITTDSLIIRKDAVPTDTTVSVATSYANLQWFLTNTLIVMDTLYAQDTIISIGSEEFIYSYIISDTTVTLDTIIRDFPVGVFNASFEELKLKVFPNPTSEWIQLSIDGFPASASYKLEIYSVGGQLEMERDLDHSRGQWDVNIGKLAPGVHLIKVRNDEGELGVVKLMKRP